MEAAQDAQKKWFAHNWRRQDNYSRLQHLPCTFGDGRSFTGNLEDARHRRADFKSAKAVNRDDVQQMHETNVKTL
jgi:hypothetical protein